MTEEERQAEREWTLRMAALEEGIDVRAGSKTISDMVIVARLQDEWERQQSNKLAENSKPSQSRRPRKPALMK